MEMVEEKTLINEIPILMMAKGTFSEAALKGTILFYHGFTAEAEVNRKELKSLAAHGFLAVGVDNVGHGRRRLPDFEARFSAGQDWHAAFLQLVRATVDELPALVDALTERDLVMPGRLGVMGISMGGFITYGALLKDRRIKAAAPMIASPAWTFQSKDADQYFPTAVISQTAGLDQQIDPGEAERFHQTLARYYQDAPERNVYINYPKSPHMMRGQDFELAWDRVLQWFERFLQPVAWAQMG